MSQAAIYARVSSEQQADADTIGSQVAALRDRVLADDLALGEAFEFIDAGYSGATLVRPGLEQLRDQIAQGTIDRLYVHSPDRLARKYAYQVLLVDEFARAGVEVVFLNRGIGETPEDTLLLEVQGIMAEYERAKIMERSRRGKRHAAQCGNVNAFSGSPYGYRYVTKYEGGGQARYEVIWEEARVVRQIYEWVGRERLTIGEVCRRLQNDGEKTRKQKASWDRSTVWGILKNPAYVGTAAFGKTRCGPMQPRLRAQRGRSLQPRRGHCVSHVDPEDWILVPVPALIEPNLFAAVQEQLRENRRTARTHETGARHLLQGLIVCAQCGYAYYGKPVSLSSAKGHRRDYVYYRCIGTDAYRFGGERRCNNKQIRSDQLELAVWQEVRALLEEPNRLEQELNCRTEQPNHDDADLNATQSRIGRLRQGISRLIDSYAEGTIDKSEFEPRLSSARQRIAQLEEHAAKLQDMAARQQEMALVVGRLTDFARTVEDGLDSADWMTRREIIRALVRRVEIDEDQVHIVFRVEPDPGPKGPDSPLLQHCRRCAVSAACQHPFG